MAAYLARGLGALLILGTVAAAAPALAQSQSATLSGHPRVLDGNTLQFESRRVVLFGVRAPGANEKCKAGSLPWLCGAQARSRLEALVRGKTVECVMETPSKGRCLVPEGDVAALMVADGLAVADREGEDYKTIEARARQKRVGIWR